jgi:hypothetical protein
MAKISLRNFSMERYSDGTIVTKFVNVIFTDRLPY